MIISVHNISSIFDIDKIGIKISHLDKQFISNHFIGSLILYRHERYLGEFLYSTGVKIIYK